MNPVSAPARSTVDELAVNTVRTLAMDAVEAAKSGHPGTPMGLAPLGYVLYSRVMRHSPANPGWPNRDRFVLSAGHASMLQYALLHLSGYDLPLEELKRFRQWGSRCPGHPEYGLTPGVEVSTGPLGQGLGNAVGFALGEAMLAERFNRQGHAIVDYSTFVVCSDGDMQEGVGSEAASLAGNLGLGKLIAIYDDNHISIEGSTDIAFCEKVAHRFIDYGWHVQSLHEEVDLQGIELALEEAKGVTDKPSLIVLRTHIGFGSPNKQDTADAHGAPLGEEEVRLTKQRLGWPFDEPFFVPSEVRELFATVHRRGLDLNSEWAARFEHYARENPDLAAEFERLRRRDPPPALAGVGTPAFSPEDGRTATRAASGKALNWLAPHVPELVGGAADLAPSTATYLDGEGDILHHSFRGRNLHFGVREHAMGTVVNGLVLSGLRAYGATFLVFSDYMRAPIRMAALMEIPSVFVFTHDSIGVGEDGPTHQPVEQLAALRAMPNVEVIRPADANETMQAWRWAVERCTVPTVLVFSRQALPILDPEQIPADAVERGAYAYRDPDGEPDLILIGTGSEVSLCLEAADALAGRGIAARVVSMPSFERFAAQPREYRDSVLPPSVGARLSVEAGSPLGWVRWVGDRGASVALDRFGASAPAKELNQHFGFTPEAVAARAQAVIER